MLITWRFCYYLSWMFFKTHLFVNFCFPQSKLRKNPNEL